MRIIHFFLILFLIADSACSSNSTQAPNTTAPAASPQPENISQVSNPTQFIPTSTKVKTIFPTLTPLPSKPQVKTAAPETRTGFISNFPIAPETVIDKESNPQDEPDDTHGWFRLISGLPVQDLVAFYEKTLPAQGWILRYADPNHIGGVRQEWKKDGTYLSLDFGYVDASLLANVAYNRIDPADLQKLPKDFPLPENAELVDASDGSWDFYIPQDFSSVKSFYQQELAALQWTQKPGFSGGSMGGEGDGDGGSSGPQYPPGVKPMPTPTYDLRASSDLAYIMPDTNEVWITITPHGNEAIMHVDLLLKETSASGLPADFPIYEGAENQFVSPGSLAYQVNAGSDAVKAFYESQMVAAGWEHDGDPIEASGTYLQNWKKDQFQVIIALAAMGDNKTMVSINCTGCQ